MGPIRSVRREVAHLRANDRGPVLLVVAGGWGTLLGARMIYPVLLPSLRSEFGLSLTVAGFLVTVLWLGSALGQLPGGIIADRYNERSVLIAGTLVVAGWVALVILGTVHALLRYRRWRFQLDADSLFLVRGVITRVDTSVPYVRVQHVDTQRSPWERALGLSSVVVFTAGSRGADITIPGLRPERATELRERLRDLAIESEGADAV